MHGNDKLRHGYFDHLVQCVAAMGFNEEKGVEKKTLPRKRAARALVSLWSDRTHQNAS